MIEFQKEVVDRIAANASDKKLCDSAADFMLNSTMPKYSYNFKSLSRPIIQYPQDMIAMQEIIWEVKPDLIIETGIAHGGSLIMYASMFSLLDYCDAVEKGEMLDPQKPARRVLGIDIDIREHNRKAIESHPMFSRIDMIEGSSIDSKVVNQVHEYAGDYKNILVTLDSMHTHDHVLSELEAYAPLVTKNSYCVVFDTVIEDMPDDMFPDRPWSKGNNPKTAVWEYLRLLKEDGRKDINSQTMNFEIDKMMENKLLIQQFSLWNLTIFFNYSK